MITQRISLGDAITPINGWGSSLDIHIGDFTGSGRSEILLYDRDNRENSTDQPVHETQDTEACYSSWLGNELGTLYWPI